MQIPCYRDFSTSSSPRPGAGNLDRARGQITLNQDQIRIANAELRLPPPPPANGQPAAAQGLLTGNFMYGTRDAQVSFDLTGAVLPLEGISLIQTSRLPIGGQLSFQLKGNGPLRAPQIDGALRLVNLRLGTDVWGSFQSHIASDGKQLALTVDSDASTGEVHGRTQVTLGGDYPITGQITLRQVDLDAFISAALHLESQTGHSSIDGEFTWPGALLHPETMQVDANLSRLSVNYAYVNLENNGPVQMQYSGKQVRIQQATLSGPDTNLEVSGSARLAGDRTLDLRTNGEVNLRLLSVFAPKTDAQGPARVDAGITGTLDNPRVTGQVEIQDASFRYGDFPAGLSHVKGDLIFDTTRMVFDNVTAESGGGQLAVNGILTYGNGPLRYDVAVRPDRVRIRYPVGLEPHWSFRHIASFRELDRCNAFGPRDRRTPVDGRKFQSGLAGDWLLWSLSAGRPQILLSCATCSSTSRPTWPPTRAPNGPAQASRPKRACRFAVYLGTSHPARPTCTC